jgi:NTE family protein
MNNIDLITGERPRIALVLGSGGVRSAAALGVVEALGAEGLYPDIVVGCSSGALFGALVASRIPTPDALEQAVGLWSQDLTQRQRWLSYLQLLAPGLFGFDEDFGLRDSALIRQRITTAFGQAQIDRLPVALRVVTTDVCTGQRVVLRHGNLVDALCASMALPVVFPPVLVEGRRLMDGVICDPLPVSVAHDADIVIALGFEGRMPSVVHRPGKLVGRVSTALINNLMQARMDTFRALGGVVLPLQLELTRRVGLWETAAMPAMRDAGGAAMVAAMPALRRALQAPAHWRAHGIAPALA